MGIRGFAGQIRAGLARSFAPSLGRRLFVVVGMSLAAVLVYAGVSIYSLVENADSLSTVYKRHVRPAGALMEMDAALKEVRFRMAGYLLDQAPIVGNRNHLREARAALLSAWGRFKKDASGHLFSPEEQRLIETIEGHLIDIEPLFRKIDAAYADDDKNAIAEILDDIWPHAIQATLQKPIARLVPSQQAAIEVVYHRSVEQGRNWIVLEIITLMVVISVLFIVVSRLAAKMHRQLRTAAGIAQKVARGDWSGEIEATSKDEVGQLLYAIQHMRDQVQSRERRLETILNNTAEGVITFDRWGLIESFNQAAERLLGWSEKEVLGTSIGQLIVPHVGRAGDYFENFLRREVQQLLGHEDELVGRRRDGTTFPLSIKISTMTLEGNIFYVALVADMSERKAMVERLKNMAEHDGLTGLYNRRYFQEELEQVVERVLRGSDPGSALLYIDLDNFKYVNDTLGYAAGDQLIGQVADLLRQLVRRSDFIARFGGDEFVVLLYHADADQAANVAELLQRRIADFAFYYEGQRADVGCSIGVVTITRETESAAKVLSQADVACHLAKRQGRNRVHMFASRDAKDVEMISVNMGWSQRIKQALERNRFVLACQPIVETRTRTVAAYEVLVRMLDENDGLVTPSGFIPAAERFGLAAVLDRWIILHAIETLAAQRGAAPHICFSINLSGKTLTSLGMAQFIREELTAASLDPTSLIFEITETAAISDINTAVALLEELKAIGCRTALDDFGAGMSSFAYLRELPVDIVKIDGRFVRNLATNPIDQAMVRAMNDIAHVLGKQTVAEFVENEESLLLLSDYGVDFVQGYHLGRPEAITPCEWLTQSVRLRCALR